MMRSMFSAVAGLKAHQTKMDVIGNNIANVNTVGFKGSRVTFKEVFSQTIKGASASQGGRGGTNPQQIGLGVTVGSIDTLHTRGSVESTDVPTDLMINGDGFFMVSDDPSFLNRSYTRAGNFKIDATGNLNLDGYRVLGYRVDESTIGENPTYNTNLEGLVISKNMKFPAQVTGVKGDSTQPSDGRDVTIEGNLNADLGLDADIVEKDTDGDGDAEYLISKDQLQTNPQYVTVYDELGGEHELKLTFKRRIDNTDLTTPSGYEDYYVYNSSSPVSMANKIQSNSWDLEIEPVGNELANSTTGAVTIPDITFTDGKVVRDKINIQLSRTTTITDSFANGAGTFNFNLALRNDDNEPLLTQFSSDDSTVHIETMKGYKQGTLNDYAIGDDGVVTAYFTNGKRSSIGRIGLANFKNPAGLQKTQENLFVDTANSGSPIIGKPGSSGFSTLIPGSLEMSNVDLAKEFTTMITTQRGFQANSRVITSTDEMLQELVNLKR